MIEEDEFCLEYIHRNLRWRYLSNIVAKYKSLKEFVGHEHFGFMANGNEILMTVGIDNYVTLLMRLEFCTEEKFYVIDDGNGKLRLSQFVKWHVCDEDYSEHRTGEGSDEEFEADKKLVARF